MGKPRAFDRHCRARSGASPRVGEVRMYRLLVVALVGLLIGCAPAAPVASTSAPAAPAAGQPVKGGTLVFASPIEPGSMDPRLQNDTAACRIDALVFNGLTTIDQNLEPQPDLADKI